MSATPEPTQKRSTGRPSFLVRLSNLIVVQSLFVFAALALIFLWPRSENVSEGDPRVVQQAMANLSAQLTGQPDPGSLDSTATQGDIQLNEGEQLRSAGLFVYGADSALTCIATITGSNHREYMPGASENVAASADLGLVRAVMDQQPGFFISTLHDAGSSLHYYRTIDKNSYPAVAVAIVRHQLFISQRPELVHALFLLFLVSILISLLTVYFIRKRFREPLNRLQRGLDSTAVGDRFYMVEPSHDEELGALAASFNRMNEALWNSRLSLDAFNQRLQKISVSLMETQGFLATLIESSPDAVLVTSPEGEVIICNRQAATTFGADSSELLGKPICSLFARSSAQQDCPVVSSDEGASFESICSRADGHLLPVFVVLRPVRDKNGNIGAFLYILRDISESRNYQEMMIRIDRYYTRGEMAGDIAHEINNYLAVLSGNLELLPILQRKGDQEKITKKFDLMRGTVEKIAGFCDGLMDSGREELSIEPTDINQAVQNVLAFLKPQNKFDTITISTNLSSEVPLVEADPGQVQQLLVNTIYNAAEALSAVEDPRTIDIVTSVVASSKPNRVIITIADNGPGVVADRVDWLFVRRFTTKPKGHGIGLVTCKRIIDAHFGTISYRYDHGAAFQIELPVKHPVAVCPSTTAVPGQEAPVA